MVVGMREDEWLAMVNVVKLILGSGSLALPWAFAQSGMLFGCGGLLIVALLASSTIWMLVETKHEIRERGLEVENYADIAGAVLGEGWASVVKISTGISCLGACAAYMTFVGDVFGSLLGVKTTVVIVGAVPAYIALSWVRTWRNMAAWSIFGNVSFFLAMAAVCFDAGRVWIERGWNAPADVIMFRGSTLPMFWGPAVFLFCIHYVALPIENDMERPKNFTKTVIPTAFGFCAVLNVSFAGFCYFVRHQKLKGKGGEIAEDVLPHSN